jgi:hypothetical protein
LKQILNNPKATAVWLGRLLLDKFDLKPGKIPGFCFDAGWSGIFRARPAVQKIFCKMEHCACGWMFSWLAWRA